MPTALIAEDEPLLRERLAGLLKDAWPELDLVAEARNGREALALFEERQPQLVFLDVHMPGVNGIEVARSLGRRAEIVSTPAFAPSGVEAFERGAVDRMQAKGGNGVQGRGVGHGFPVKSSVESQARSSAG